MKRRFPFVRPPVALLLLRGALALFFMAHALVRLVNGSVPQFGAFLERGGWPQGVLLVHLISAGELAAGSAMLAGRWVRWAAAYLFFIAGMGIVLIHARLGWFVGEHGVGGMEYSLSLMVGLLTVAAFDAQSLDGGAGSSSTGQSRM
jgi:putative oxidoreductase